MDRLKQIESFVAVVARGSLTAAANAEGVAPAVIGRRIDALEAAYPVLQGAIRDHVTYKRRPFLRFFACQQDLSHEDPDAPLPEPVASGTEVFVILGAIAGG